VSLVRAAHQELTRSWCESRDSYALFASQLVIDEASAGDLTAANRRLEALRGIPLVGLTEEVAAISNSCTATRDATFPRIIAGKRPHWQGRSRMR
jgi:hypothetical protein